MYIAGALLNGIFNDQVDSFGNRAVFGQVFFANLFFLFGCCAGAVAGNHLGQLSANTAAVLVQSSQDVTGSCYINPDVGT